MRTAGTVEAEKSERGIGLNIVLLVYPPFESEFQFVIAVDLGQQLRQLAGVLALPVVAVRILSDAGVTGGIVIVDADGGNAEKSIGPQIRRKTKRAQGIRVQAFVVGIDQRRAAREAKRGGQDQRGAEGVRIVDRETGAPCRRFGRFRRDP